MSLVLNVEILGEFKNLTAATKGAQTQLSTMNQRAQSVSANIGRAFAAIGVGFSLRIIQRELEEASKAAIEDVKSQTLLANQMRNTTAATDDQIKSIEKQINKLQLSASIADDELRPAYATLLRTTESTTKAMDLLTLATDVSAGSGKSLTSVTMALSKAYQGKMASLTKLGIPMTDSIQNASDYSKEMTKLNKLQMESANTTGPEHVKAMEKIAEQQDLVNRIAEAGIDWQGDLAKAFQGSAEAAANTDPYQKMQIIFGELQESVGMTLLPVLEDFSTWLVDVIPDVQKFFQELTDPTTEMGEKWAGMWEMIGLVGQQFNGLLNVFSGGQNGFSMVIGWITKLAAGLGQVLFYFGKVAEQQKAFFSGDWAKSIDIAANYISDYNKFVQSQNRALDAVSFVGTGTSTTNNININLTGTNVTAQDIVNKLKKLQKTSGSAILAY